MLREDRVLRTVIRKSYMYDRTGSWHSDLNLCRDWNWMIPRRGGA
jgi:hypothetical protein